jgi:hypothetical protein
MVSGTPCTHRAHKCSGQFCILEDGCEEKASIEKRHRWYIDCVAGGITDRRLIHRDVA